MEWQKKRSVRGCSRRADRARAQRCRVQEASREGLADVHKYGGNSLLLRRHIRVTQMWRSKTDSYRYEVYEAARRQPRASQYCCLGHEPVFFSGTSLCLRAASIRVNVSSTSWTVPRTTSHSKR